MKKYVEKNQIIEDYKANILDIFEVSKAFDKLTGDLNKGGVVYTPKNIAEFMVLKIKPKISDRVVEFCVGHGVFVFALLKYFKSQNESNKNVKDFVENRLFAYDVSVDSILEFRDILKLFLKKEFDLNDLNLNNISVKNSLDYINNDISFDISIGNPPYVRFQNLDAETRKGIQKNFKSCKSGNVDLYFAFLELAKKKSTRSINIVQNSYLRNKSAKGLRSLLKDSVSYIKDFKAEQVFEDVGTYTSIILLDNEKTDTFEYEDLNGSQILEKSCLTDYDWNLDNITKLTLLQNKNNVMENVAKVYSGLATLADNIFILKQSIVNGFVPVKIGDQSFEIESGILKKYLKISKIKKEDDVEKYTYNIIYPYDVNGKIIEEKELAERFPNTYKYLLFVKNELMSRDKGKVEKYDAWYSYGRKQGFPVKQKGSVILVPGMVSSEVKFAIIEKSEDYLFGSGFMIQPEKKAIGEIRESLAKRDFFDYLELTGKIWKGKDNKNFYSPNKNLLLKYSF